MSDTIQSILNNIPGFLYNPAMIQREFFKHLDKVTNGEVNIVDATNPFVFHMEATSVCIAAFMAQDEAENRKQYPVAAQLPEELYPHMSDKDYLNRFAVPSKAQMLLFFDKKELLDKMVYDPATGMKKLMIPRNTFIVVSDVTFSLQYPIEIRQPAHGGLQVVYIADKISPLQTLITNQIPAVVRNNGDMEMLVFPVDVQQFSIQSLEDTPSSATAFDVTMTVADRYCFARVWAQNSNMTWTEIRTTHTDQVYDIAIPTAALQLVGNQLRVQIPQIYTLNGGSNKIRIDVYQTKGELNMDLSAYSTDSVSITWFAIDSSDLNDYTAPLANLRVQYAASESRTQGGRAELPFAQLRQQVIDGSTGESILPITNVVLEAEIEQDGFKLVTNIDNVTNRALLATRSMPKPTNPELITEAGASIEMIETSIANALTNRTVIDNGDNVTITPATLYQSKNGIMRIVSDAEVAAIEALVPEQKALKLTKGNYYYSPFHYVLDSSGLEFESRPYYLDGPTTVSKSFIGENDTTLLQVSTDKYILTKKESTLPYSMGYNLRILVVSNDAYKALDNDQCFVQLAFIPEGESDRAYLNGKYVGLDPTTNERMFDFDIGTTFDVDTNHHLIVNKFKMYVDEARLTPAKLTTTFDILFATNAVMSEKWVPKAVDKVLGRFLLPNLIYGITNETIDLRFGDSLRTLWAQARTVAGSMKWKRHVVDKPRLYEKDVYRADPLTQATIEVVNGELVYEIIHRAGDNVLNAAGELVYDYRIGDIVYDAFGNPEPADVRGIEHQLDIFLVEGVYKFATEPSAVGYRNELVNTVVSWLVDGLTDIKERLLEKTRIFYYPQATLGQIEVLTTFGFSSFIDASQSILLKLAVPPSVKKNKELLKEISKTTTRIISQYLAKETVSVSEITSALRDAYASDVIDVELSGIGGDKNYQVLTVSDKTKRCSIRKRLVAQPDGSLIVEEDITIDVASLEK